MTTFEIGTKVEILTGGAWEGPFTVAEGQARTADHLVLQGQHGTFEHYNDAPFNTRPAEEAPAEEAPQVTAATPSTITRLENAHREVRMALEAGQEDAAYSWTELADAIHARLQREADMEARIMARITGSVSGTYTVTYTDGTVAVVGAWSK